MVSCDCVQAGLIPCWTSCAPVVDGLSLDSSWAWFMARLACLLVVFMAGWTSHSSEEDNLKVAPDDVKLRSLLGCVTRPFITPQADCQDISKDPL
jgi:hypothetical protein